MASGEQKFPPQKQETQPGKEHAMDPIPQLTSPDYNPSNKLQGKIALIRGGDSGIGRAVCNLFALEGATVAFTYLKGQEEKDAKDTLEMINRAKSWDASKEPVAIPTDLGYYENCKKVVDEVVNRYGRIDVMINNAAEQYEAGSVEEIDEKRLESVQNQYLRLFLHGLACCIINTTSVTAYRGNAKLLDYRATKGAIVAFIRGLSLELVGRKIRVNGGAPGPIWTPLILASFKEDQTSQIGLNSLLRCYFSCVPCL